MGSPDGFPDFRGARAHCIAPASAVRVTSSSSSPKESHSEIKLTLAVFPRWTLPSSLPRALEQPLTGQGRGGPEARAASDESYVSAWHSNGGAHPRIKNNHKSALLEFFLGGTTVPISFPPIRLSHSRSRFAIIIIDNWQIMIRHDEEQTTRIYIIINAQPEVRGIRNSGVYYSVNTLYL